MTYWLYGATLGFTWFLALNIALSLVVAALARPLAARLAGVEPAARARALLAARLLPSGISTLFVAAVFLPSFLRLEPRNFDEAFGLTTTTFAVVSCALLVASSWRAVSAVAELAARTRGWLRRADAIALPDAPVPAFCLDAPTPSMSLVGLIRPKLLVTRSLVDLLTRDELAAAIAHEAGHHGSRDNLKRLAMRATPDALSVLGACRLLEREWALAAEQAADAHAARDRARGLALASALLKVARLTPPDPAGALVSPLVGGRAVASRVSRLVEPAGEPRRRSLLARAAVVASGLTAAGLAVASYGPLLESVHNISEVLVRVLP
jgi:hypothetical protein